MQICTSSNRFWILEIVYLNGPVLCVYISVAFVTSFLREPGHKRKICET